MKRRFARLKEFIYSTSIGDRVVQETLLGQIFALGKIARRWHLTTRVLTVAVIIVLPPP